MALGFFSSVVRTVAAIASEDRSGPAPWLTWLESKLDTERKAVGVVLAIGFLLFFPYLGTLGLWDCWETHYGEVAREMIARDDYVYPHWESAYFFSKPVLPLWLIALGLFVTGAEFRPPDEPLGALAEWGIRTPFALIAILTLWAVYRMGRQLRDRTTGVISAIVLASCCQFIFIGKQAMADMPLVGFMTAALALFCAAVFDEEEDAPASSKLRIGTSVGLAIAVFVQLILIGREMRSMTDMLPIIGAGVVGAAFIAAVMLRGSRRDCYLVGFYVMMGLAALSKGLAVLYVVGPTVVLYMLFTFDFRILQRCRVLLGGVLFLLVASPWYVTLSLFKGRDEEGNTFVQRFWLHDNLNRVGAGVHGDRGGMGYYIEQLAYGMFPWIAVVPLSLGLAARTTEEEIGLQRRRMLLFVLLWAVWSYVGFTVNLTKFHHYIFPAVPALALLVGIWFVWAAKDPTRRLVGYAAIIVMGIFAVAARDLIDHPQHLVSLFTYKYDRDYPREINPRLFLIVLSSVGGAAMFIFYALRDKSKAMLAFAATAVIFGTWISHYHFNMLAPHWSQAHLFKTYFDERRGDEPMYAYQLNWRGETFYTRNRVLQVKESGANERMRQLVDRPGREFIVTEQSRFHTLRGVLSPDKRDKLQIIDKSSNKFYLCVVEE